MGLLERLYHVLGEATPHEPDDVRPDHLHAALDHVAEHVRRHVLPDLAHSADHGMPADRAELVRRGAAADDHPVLQMHVAGKLHGVRADDVVAQNDPVRSVAVAHEEAVRADHRLLAVRSPEVDCREFAYDRPVADLDVACGALLVLEVLGLHADAGVREDLALLADRGVAVDDGPLADRRAVADAHRAADMGVRAYLDVRAERRAVFDYRCWMYLCHELFPPFDFLPPLQMLSHLPARQQQAGDDRQPYQQPRVHRVLVFARQHQHHHDVVPQRDRQRYRHAQPRIYAWPV